MQNIFEYATRSKLRFASIKGELTVEQLWLRLNFACLPCLRLKRSPALYLPP